MFGLFNAFRRLAAAVERLAGHFESACEQIEARQHGDPEPAPVMIDQPAANGRRQRAKSEA